MRRYTSWVHKNLNSLENKNVLVTGATGGIAFHIIDYLLELKANVIMAVRNLTKGEEKKALLEKLHEDANIYLYELDITCFDSFDGFISKLEDFGHIDFLINNAGIYHLKPVNNEYGMELHFATNFFGPMLFTEKVLPLLNQSRGKVITMGSIAYFFAKIDFEDIYGAKTKNRTQIYGKTKKLLMLESLYLKNKGENIVLVHPGITASTLFDTLHGGFSRGFGRFIVPIMHLLFFSPSKAALSAVAATTLDVDSKHWLGPRGLFHVWGYPRVNKLRKNVLDEEVQLKTNEAFVGLKEKVRG